MFIGLDELSHSHFRDSSMFVIHGTRREGVPGSSRVERDLLKMTRSALNKTCALKPHPHASTSVPALCVSFSSRIYLAVVL